MFRIPLPLRDTSLMLTPRFGEWPAYLQFGLIVLLCVAPLALILWLYRYELRFVPGGAPRCLLARGVAVRSLLLARALFQPIAAQSWWEALPGRVLIPVDRPDSMDVAAPQRAPA